MIASYELAILHKMQLSPNQEPAMDTIAYPWLARETWLPKLLE
jgi:hypothetical protein